VAPLRHVHLVQRHGLGVAVRPQFGPDRQDDAYPLTEAAEAAAVRRMIWQGASLPSRPWQLSQRPATCPTTPGADADWLSEIEAYGSAEQLGTARDLELWGDDPFGEGE